MNLYSDRILKFQGNITSFPSGFPSPASDARIRVSVFIIGFPFTVHFIMRLPPAALLLSCSVVMSDVVMSDLPLSEQTTRKYPENSICALHLQSEEAVPFSLLYHTDHRSEKYRRKNHGNIPR